MKKNSREWLEKEASLKVRAMVSLAKSHVIKEDAEKANNDVQNFLKRYPDQKMDSLAWDEREKCITETEAIVAALDDVEKRLRSLEEEYTKLREETNEFYGEEVLRPFNSLGSLGSFRMPTDESDSADWWKK